MKVNKVIDVCDGDYTMIQIEIQDECAKCSCDILHKASIGEEGKKICLDCYADEIWKNV